MRTDSSSTRIFMVEGEALASTELAGWLRTLGYDPCGQAACGEAALESIIESKPDLVLMDIHLLGSLTGMDIAEALRGHLDVPVIFLATDSDAELVAGAIRAEACGYLIKPFDERELAANIEMALYRYAIRKKLRQSNRLLEQRTAELEAIRHQLREAQKAVQELHGVLPICVSCRKVREDQDYWQSVEAYIRAHAEASFSHGTCPECHDVYREGQNSANPPRSA